MSKSPFSEQPEPDGHSPYSRLDELTREPVLNHAYDGIEELDNPLPGWWLMTFYLTIVFAAGYFTWHNIVGGGQVHERAYRSERAAVEAKLAALAKTREAKIDPAAFAKEVSDPALLPPGKQVFAAKCTSCHGNLAEGLIGPNLTDAHWINGDGTPLAVFQVIEKGVNDKGMPPWGALLKPEELRQVTAYVLSLAGSNPPHAKPPQGEPVKVAGK